MKNLVDRNQLPATRVVVVGYHEIACQALLSLDEHNVAIVAYFPNPLRVGQADYWYRDAVNIAEKLEIPVEDPLLPAQDELFSEFLIDENVDVLMSCFSATVFGRKSLESVRLATNFHNSDLPFYKGRAAPIRALQDGQSSIALCYHHMTSSVDEGHLIDRIEIKLLPKMTICHLYLLVAEAQSELLEKWIPKIAAKQWSSFFQKKSFEHCTDPSLIRGKVSIGALGFLDFSEPASRIDAVLRAFSNPFPGGWFECNGKKIHVIEWEIEIGIQSKDTEWEFLPILTDQSLKIPLRDGALHIHVAALDGRWLSHRQLAKYLIPYVTRHKLPE